ncbi:MAG: hypothetical protein LBK73_11180 [Treponema sp.]|jgi:hypothetical protein|nr:hypothetical protein [Treponema sp.]
MDGIAAEYGVCKGAVCLAIQWVEDTLVKGGAFALPGKKVLKRKSESVRVHRGRRHGKSDKPAERRSRSVLFGEKKRHTPKTQVITGRDTLEILDVQEAKGGGRDFKVYKESIGSSVGSSMPIDTDLGYLGIQAYHPNSFIPIKSSKNHELSEDEKEYNRELARRRIVIEHINAKIKTYKSMAYPYRGHYCNRHSMRMTLVCGLISYDWLI